jgi:hypothetical protein
MRIKGSDMRLSRAIIVAAAGRGLKVLGEEGLCTDGWDRIAVMLWPARIFTNYLPEGSVYIDKIDLLPVYFREMP